MAEITAADVKALRDATGLGMMECKKALTEAGGDSELALENLKKQGLAKAEKKASRETKHGLVAICDGDGGAAMVEVVCESDFTSRNEEFQGMVAAVAKLAAAAPAGEVETTDEIAALVQECLAKISENMKFSRGVKIVAPKIGRYIHHDNMTGVLIGVEGEIDEETLTGVCQHIAFTDPIGITTDDIPADLVEAERKLAADSDAVKGKPEQIVEKIVEGKVRKFLAENALLEQAYVRDEDRKVGEILGTATITAFARFKVSE